MVAPSQPTEYDIAGSWEPLADMPGGDDFRTSDAVWLSEHELAVFRWDYGTPDPEEPEVVVYDVEADSWRAAEFDGARPGIGTDQPFALGNDGRIYSHIERIDVSRDTWSVEEFRIVTETEVWAGMTLAAGGDGRIYRSADDTGSSVTELVVYDPKADAFTRSSRTAGNFDLVFADADGDLVLFGASSGEPAFIRYDIARDAWSKPMRYSADIDTYSVAIDDDGIAYAPTFSADRPGIVALDLGSPEPLSVRAPEIDGAWDVHLVSSPAGEIYALGTDEAWRFAPDR